MRAIARIAEERIVKAIEEGRFEGLPGEGKPLAFEDETWVPEDLRMAYRVLKNAAVLPPELELRGEIMNLRALIEKIDDDAERLKKIRELNFKLLCLNERRKRPLYLEEFPEYESKIVERLAG